MDVEIRQVAEPIYANARGAAWIGAVGLGLISFTDVPRLVHFKKVYTPNPGNRAVYDNRFSVFKQIYKQMKNVYKHMNS
jgi:xylulokinase